MTLYHVSVEPVQQFVPRVPKQRCPGEDGTIKRICCCKNIFECINAMPGGASVIDCLLHLCKNAVIYVYQFIVPDDADWVFNPAQTVRYVPDAEISGEYWLIKTPDQVLETMYLIHDIQIDHGIDRYGKDIYGLVDFAMDPVPEREEPENNIQRILSRIPPSEQNQVMEIFQKYGLVTVLRNIYRELTKRRNRNGG